MALPLAGAAVKHPNVQVTLDDGTDKIGLMLLNPGALNSNPNPRTATQISQGQSEYSDLVLPYKEKVQRDWSGGRGQLDLEDNATKYMDAKAVITHHENRLVLGGQAEWADDYLRTTLGWGLLPPGRGAMDKLHLYETIYAIGCRNFNDPSTVTAARYILWIEKVGSPQDLEICLLEDAGTEPEKSAIANTVATLDASDFEDSIGKWVVISANGGASSSAGPYICFSANVADDVDNHWILLNDSLDGTGFFIASSLGGAWAQLSDGMPYIRVVSTDDEIPGKYFNYKSVEYFVSQPTDGSAGKLYRNGDRGSGTGGSTTTLVDSTKSWGSNFWSLRDGYVLFLTGDASRQNKPYSAITSNNGTTLTFGAVDIAPAAGDTYAIIGTTYFESIQSFTQPVTDFSVADRFVAFAFGEDQGVKLFYEYDNAGTWTKGLANTATKAEKIKAIRRGDGDMLIWGTRNDRDPYGTSVWFGWVPELIGSNADMLLHNRVGVLATTSEAWQEQRIANVTSSHQGNGIYISVGGSFTTGVISSRLLDSPVDISGARYVGFMARSSVTTASGDLKFVIDQVAKLGQSYLPAYVFHYRVQSHPSSVYFYHAADTAYYALSNLAGYNNDYSFANAIQTADRLYVGFTDRFDRLIVDILAANTNAAVITVKYWNGSGWADTSATDGTISAGKSLGQDGTISFTLPARWNKGNDKAEISDVYFWLQIEWGAALSASTTIGEIRLWSSNLDKGVVESWGSFVRLLDTNTTTYDRITLEDDGYLYIGCASKFNKVTWNIGSNVQAATATMALEYGNGSGWTAVSGYADSTISGGATLAVDGDMDFDMPYDWEPMTIEGNEAYWIRMQPSADLTALVDILEVSLHTNTAKSISLPALTADVWTWVLLEMSPGVFSGDADARNIASVGLKVAVDKGAQIVQIYGGVHLIGKNLEHISLGNANEKIIGIGAYGDERRNPWIVSETQVYEIQQENDNAVVPIPLDEMATLRSLKNGTAITTSDAYLVFNMGPRLQRYLNQTLDNLGPTKDEGLPENRQGDIVAIQSAPSQIFIAIDGEDNYSSVLLYDNSGWHEIYRAPEGERIWDMHLQTLPYERDMLRLWVIQGGDILYVPVGITRPDKVAAFRYEHQGYLITSWITSGNVKVEKLFRTLHLFTEDLSAGSQEIKVQYQVDSGELDSGWTDIATYDTSPVEENYISTVGSNVTGTRIRFRFIFETDDNTKTPLLDAFDLEMIFRVQPRDVYVLQVIAGDRIENLDGEIDETLRSEELISQLETWADAPATLLTFNNMYSSWDAKTVVLEPFPQSVDQPIISGDEVEGVERILCELALMEV